MALERMDPRLGPDAVVLRFPASEAMRVRRTARRARALRRSGLMLVAAGIVLVSLVGGASRDGARAAAGTSRAPEAVVLHRGETLWDLAVLYAPPTTDPRVYVDALWRLNRLDGPPQAGARIRLPR
ncbi:MAG: LysM peptidoglycan-binding domain-containing protein [Actinomycetota bacterium]